MARAGASVQARWLARVDHNDGGRHLGFPENGVDVRLDTTILADGEWPWRNWKFSVTLRDKGPCPPILFESASLQQPTASAEKRNSAGQPAIVIVFPLRALSPNSRKEIAKGRKVYSYDLGIRNALIKSFNDLHLRADVGALWENFCVNERLKHNQYTGRMINPWFWRTYDQKELDFVEESGGRFAGFEFKWGGGSARGAKAFPASYDTTRNPRTFVGRIRLRGHPKKRTPYYSEFLSLDIDARARKVFMSAIWILNRIPLDVGFG